MLDASGLFNGYFGLFNGYFVQPEPQAAAGGRELGSELGSGGCNISWGPWVAVGDSVWRADRRLGTVEYFPYLPYDSREAFNSQADGLVNRVPGEWLELIYDFPAHGS